MNRNSRIISKPLLCFSKWSRKSYAVFSSLGKLIKISNLKVDVSQGFIKKSISTNKFLQFIITGKIDDDEAPIELDLKTFNLIMGVNSLPVIQTNFISKYNKQSNFTVSLYNELNIFFISKKRLHYAISFLFYLYQYGLKSKESILMINPRLKSGDIQYLMNMGFSPRIKINQNNNYKLTLLSD